jgi:hypothetical protein
VAAILCAGCILALVFVALIIRGKWKEAIGWLLLCVASAGTGKWCPLG